MPIYEYECNGCHRRVSLLILSPSTAPPPTCPRCGSQALNRLLSRFVAVKSEESRLESLADPSKFGDLDENDPKSMARWMKKMGQEIGEDLGEAFDAAVDESMEMEGSEPESGGDGEGGGADEL